MFHFLLLRAITPEITDPSRPIKGAISAGRKPPFWMSSFFFFNGVFLKLSCLRWRWYFFNVLYSSSDSLMFPLKMFLLHSQIAVISCLSHWFMNFFITQRSQFESKAIVGRCLRTVLEGMVNPSVEHTLKNECKVCTGDVSLLGRNGLFNPVDDAEMKQIAWRGLLILLCNELFTSGGRLSGNCFFLAQCLCRVWCHQQLVG